MATLINGVPVATFAAAPTVAVDDATTNAATTCLTLSHTTTGTAANGIGARVLLRSEDAAGNAEDVAALDGVLTNAGNGAEASAFVVHTRTGGGALAETLRVLPGGVLRSTDSLNVQASDQTGLVVSTFALTSLSGSNGGQYTLAAALDTVGLRLFARITTGAVAAHTFQNSPFGTSFGASSGTQQGIREDWTLNQSGTAGFDCRRIDLTKTTVGSGGRNFLRCTVGGSTEIFQVTDTGLIKQDTSDSTGAPGNATINKPAGKSAVAAGASSVTITNSLVTADSIVHATINQSADDATATQIRRIVTAAGSFTVHFNANATAATSFMWSVTGKAA